MHPIVLQFHVGPYSGQYENVNTASFTFYYIFKFKEEKMSATGTVSLFKRKLFRIYSMTYKEMGF